MNRNGLEFNCEEDIEKMPVTDCGRFCAVCQREIYDFRGVSKKQLEAFREKDVCGIFLPEQVEDGITPIRLPKVRYVTASFLTFLGMEVYGQLESTQQQPFPTEISANDSTTLSQSDTTKAAVQTTDPLTKREIRKFKRRFRPFISTNRASYYWSKRFPFIVRRKNHHVGVKLKRDQF